MGDVWLLCMLNKIKENIKSSGGKSDIDLDSIGDNITCLFFEDENRNLLTNGGLTDGNLRCIENYINWRTLFKLNHPSVSNFFSTNMVDLLINRFKNESD